MSTYPKTFASPHMVLWPTDDALLKACATGDVETLKPLMVAFMGKHIDKMNVLAQSACIACGEAPASGVDVFGSTTGQPPIVTVPMCTACKNHPEASALAYQRQTDIFRREVELGHPSTRRQPAPTVH